MNLKSKVKTSLLWTFGDQIVSQVALLLFGILLARMLSPSIFGVVGMVTIFSNFAVLFIDMGFGVALIQKIDATEEHFSSVFWLNLLIGILLYVFFYSIAPLISQFYNIPDLIIFVRVICLTFIITSLTSVQSNLLVRDLHFKKKVIFNWIAILLGYIVAFILAYRNYGAWSLVWMTLITASTNSILYWITSKWYPKFVFSFSKIKELSKLGLNVLGDTSINYWSRNYDNFIIGRVLGSSDLGLYTRAYSLMLLPLRNLTSVFSKVMFPAFSKKQNDLPTIKYHYLNIIKHIALVSFPLMIGLSLVSKEFVLLVFGIKWVKMIPILAILSALGPLQSIGSLNGLIYNSLGKANIAFRVSLVVNFILIIALTIGVNFGIIGITWSYFTACVLIFIPMYNTAIRQINTTLLEVFLTLKGILIATLLMALVILVTTMYLNTNLLLSFCFKIIIGSIIYLFSVYYFEKKLFWDLIYKLKKGVAKIAQLRNNNTP